MKTKLTIIALAICLAVKADDAQTNWINNLAETNTFWDTIKIGGTVRVYGIGCTNIAISTDFNGTIQCGTNYIRTSDFEYIASSHFTEKVAELNKAQADLRKDIDGISLAQKRRYFDLGVNAALDAMKDGKITNSASPKK